MTTLRLLLALLPSLLPLVPETPRAEAELAAEPVDQSLTTANLGAEFEPQRGIVIAWDRQDPDTRRVLSRLVAGLDGAAEVFVLVQDEEDRIDARRAFRSARVRRTMPRFVVSDYDTIWTRDYGPLVVTTETGHCVVDVSYGVGDRPLDDVVPFRMAEELGLPLHAAPVILDGGNLLSNGAGLVLTTYASGELNGGRGEDEDRVAGVLSQYLGAERVVFLEPLVGESTGHVDMFATFVAPNKVVVGEYSLRDDVVNADVLDRNAKALEGLPTPHGPLQVVRIPMPRRDDDQWFTYTNVVYVNRRLLVPVYNGIDPLGRAEALDVYRRLLPGWRIVPVESSHLIGLGGGLHCVTMNVPRLTGDRTRFQVAGTVPRVPVVVRGGDGGKLWRSTLDETWDLDEDEFRPRPLGTPRLDDLFPVPAPGTPPEAWGPTPSEFESRSRFDRFGDPRGGRHGLESEVEDPVWSPGRPLRLPSRDVDAPSRPAAVRR